MKIAVVGAGYIVYRELVLLKRVTMCGINMNIDQK